jgi:hypothetical protein
MEREFKRKLDLREITPTPHAWDRLEAMLNQAESKNPARTINWLYVAAAILGFALLSTAFFHDWKNGHVQIVEQKPPVNPMGSAKPQPVAPAADEQTQIAIQNRAEAEKTQTPSENIRPETKTAIRKTVPGFSKAPSEIATVDRPSIEKTEKPETIQPIDKKNPAYADADVQLADAGKLSPKPVKVDARALLDQVDGELDQSFREKVLSGASKKYQDVKVALANRNRE